MAKTDQFLAEEVVAALTKARGIQSAAAKFLGCSRGTVKRYMDKYPTIRKAAADAREDMLDYTETKLFQQISEGNMTAIIWYLKTQGKQRGYIEHIRDDLPLDIRFDIKLPPELEAMRGQPVANNQRRLTENNEDDQPELPPFVP